MDRSIYDNNYTVEQRAQYVQTRKAAIALRPQLTPGQFDVAVRSALELTGAGFAPQQWCDKARQMLALIKMAVELERQQAEKAEIEKSIGSIADYFGVAK
jgi:hypothetical protein